MDILGSLIVISLAVVVAIIIYYFLKNVLALVVNAIVGVIVLFFLNLFHVMSLFGASDLPIDWITILVSAIGGLVGVVIVVTYCCQNDSGPMPVTVPTDCAAVV